MCVFLLLFWFFFCCCYCNQLIIDNVSGRRPIMANNKLTWLNDRPLLVPGVGCWLLVPVTTDGDGHGDGDVVPFKLFFVCVPTLLFQQTATTTTTYQLKQVNKVKTTNPQRMICSIPINFSSIAFKQLMALRRLSLGQLNVQRVHIQ